MEVIAKEKKLLDTIRVCCPNNESITIKHKFSENIVLSVCFNFKYDNTGKTKYEVSSPQNGEVILDLYNFNNSGTGVVEPLPLGTYQNKQISLLFFVHKYGNSLPVLDASLYLGEVKNG